jgi:hypothetical protein
LICDLDLSLSDLRKIDDLQVVQLLLVRMDGVRTSKLLTCQTGNQKFCVLVLNTGCVGFVDSF